MITLICPSRQRPKKMFDTIQTWLKKSSSVEPLEIIISLDIDDPELGTYWQMFEEINVIRIKNNNRSAVDAINKAASCSSGNILIVVSDDFDCPEEWDKKILDATKGHTDWIIKTWDGIQKWIITLPIMDRAYYNRFGYIYFPEYLHMFCDTELSCVADLTGRKINLDVPFTHNHYSTGKSVKDNVSIKADATWNQGEHLFLERAKRKFDLVNPVGKVTSLEYINWMRTKGVSVQ